MVIGALALISTFSALLIAIGKTESNFENGNVALIKLRGPIMLESAGDFFEESGTSSTDITKLVEKADKDTTIQAIIIDINSPGGGAVASKEIAQVLKKTNKTIIAVIREIGTSGAYWVATSSDLIIADPLAITGSIGVFSSYLEFSGLLKHYNVTYQRMVAGKYKDIGSPFRKLEEQEEKLLQKQLEAIHEYFIHDVAQNRKMEDSKLRELATGEFYLGMEAKELGLIDRLGGIEDAKAILESEYNVTAVKIVEYKQEPTFFELISSVFSSGGYAVGKGIASELGTQHFVPTT